MQNRIELPKCGVYAVIEDPCWASRSIYRIKVGVSKNIPARIKSLQTGNSKKLIPFLLLEAPPSQMYEIESHLHQILGEALWRSDDSEEWFAKQIVGDIDANKYFVSAIYYLFVYAAYEYKRFAYYRDPIMPDRDWVRVKQYYPLITQKLADALKERYLEEFHNRCRRLTPNVINFFWWKLDTALTMIRVLTCYDTIMYGIRESRYEIKNLR